METNYQGIVNEKNCLMNNQETFFLFIGEMNLQIFWIHMILFLIFLQF